MKALHTWNNNDDSILKTIQLYKDKVVIIKRFNGNDFEQTFTFNEFLDKITYLIHTLEKVIIDETVEGNYILKNT